MSFNAIGLAYANQPLTHFDYFPIDGAANSTPTDSYALATKQEAELQAEAFVNWFPGSKIACLRIHEVAPRKDVQKEHYEDWEGTGVKQLWGWVHPEPTARACLLAVDKSDNFEGCEVFNIHAPTAQDAPSKELAQKHYLDVQIRGDFSGNTAFWTSDKAKEVLGGEHHETE